MKQLNLINIIPVFQGKEDFTISELRRQAAEMGQRKAALSFSCHLLPVFDYNKRTEFRVTGISLRTIDRIIKRLTNDEKIEYRGSKRTGGWYVRT